LSLGLWTLFSLLGGWSSVFSHRFISLLTGSWQTPLGLALVMSKHSTRHRIDVVKLPTSKALDGLECLAGLVDRFILEIRLNSKARARAYEHDWPHAA
jgi:hypothetical protein